MSSTEYFTCESPEKCCGDAWNRYCCDKVGGGWDSNIIYTVFQKGMDDGLIIGLAIFFSFLTLALICFIISLYHYKKKTKHYHNVVHWYENMRPSKVGGGPSLNT